MYEQRIYITLCALFGLTGALEPTGLEEGSCLRDTPYHQDFDPTLLESFPYVNVANKLYYYRLASVLPEFGAMREFDFYYDTCLVKNTSIRLGKVFLYGYGRHLTTFDLEPAGSENPGMFYVIPPQTGPTMDYASVKVTLTDYKTFAVLLQCWEREDLRNYLVMSAVPHLDATTEKLIEDHIQSLNFRRDTVVFLMYNTCTNLPAFLNETGPAGNQPGKYPLVTRDHQQNGSLKRNVISPIVTNPRTTVQNGPPPPVISTHGGLPAFKRNPVVARTGGIAGARRMPGGSGWTNY